jgi:hypothetical protein
MKEPQYIITNRTFLQIEVVQESVPDAIKGKIVVPPFASIPYGWFSCVGPKVVLVKFVGSSDDKKYKYEYFENNMLILIFCCVYV